MEWLHFLGYQGLSMSALRPYLLGEQVGKVVGITFDDGYLNNLSHALPVLKRLNFSSTCYVVSQLLGQSNLWDEAVGVPQSPLMNVDELKIWIQGGQEVGAHTRKHTRLTSLETLSSRDEIVSCKHDLESAMGAPVHHFCYPYGEYSAEHVELVESAGYLTATTTFRGRCVSGEDVLQLPRVPVVRRTNRAGLWLKIASPYEEHRRR